LKRFQGRADDVPLWHGVGGCRVGSEFAVSAMQIARVMNTSFCALPVGRVAVSERIRVKICGITRPEDAGTASLLGADALGLVFYPPSPRSVNVERARAIARNLPPFVTRVGLFVNAPADDVRRVLDVVPLDLLQFHGDELPSYCVHFGRPYIKAVRMRPGLDLEEVCRVHADAAGLLVDSYQPGVPGGTGRAFDWQSIPRGLAKPIILAGGLSAENVSLAIRRVRPYAVDVSGGVESEKGIKDPEKVRAFLRAAAQTA
jgi:phosphoribosylanthranilate isomerase